MNIFCKYNIFTGRALFTSDRKVDTWFRTHVHCRFDTVFIFVINLYKYQNVFKSIPANIVSWLGKTILMSHYWPSQSVLWWMSIVRNHEIRNKVLLGSFGLLLTCFLFWISSLGWCVYDCKNYCNSIGYLYIHKRVKSIVLVMNRV